MTIFKGIKLIVLAVCAAGFVATIVIGLWPEILNYTRLPLIVGYVGAWCTFLTITYLVTKFILAGLKRSK
jgi:hypothetical protein